jgi:CrcB protein
VRAARLRGTDLVLVAAGGAAGALLRHAVDTAAPHGLFPWPTLAVNVVGAFVLGVLPALVVVRRSRRVAVTLGPGLLGGFTTVSAWAGQVRDLAGSGHAAVAGAHVALTLAAGLGAAALGRRLAHRPDEASEADEEALA